MADQIGIGNITALTSLVNEETDSLNAWLEAYFAVEVTTAESSRRVQQRDLRRFLSFLHQETGSDKRTAWTGRLSRDFFEGLRHALKPDGSRCYADRTINRIFAHLKTFASWIHHYRPFPLGHPLARLRQLATSAGLEVERALSETERKQLLETADLLPIIGGRSRDQRRCKHITLPNERPRRKGYRPWRNRAIIYLLMETGMRRAAVTSLNLNEVNTQRRTVTVTEKGGQRHRYTISQEGLKALQDYMTWERDDDADFWQASPALFLPASGKPQSRGRLTPQVVNAIWNEVCTLAHVNGKTPHSARHAMGRHIMAKTGNAAAVQRQLGHSNVAYSLQYARITDEELQRLLDER